MADLSKPMRAVRLTLKLDADDMRELCYALRTLADHAERNELTTGVMGGSYSGYIYELLVDPTITHDSYHAALREYLDGLKNQHAEPVQRNPATGAESCVPSPSFQMTAQAEPPCDHCASPLFAARQCRVCGRKAEPK